MRGHTNSGSSSSSPQLITPQQQQQQQWSGQALCLMYGHMGQV
jgi:hypothetical protein